jgi:hypothetical protein
MNKIKEIIDKYPVSNGKWVYYKSNGVFSGTLSVNSLYEYIRHIIKNDLWFNLFNYNDEYSKVTEFFLRFNYDDRRENSDPWGRQFKAFRDGYQTVKIDVYESLAVYDMTKALPVPKMYVSTTSVEGSRIYCVDVMTEV